MNQDATVGLGNWETQNGKQVGEHESEEVAVPVVMTKEETKSMELSSQYK
jgi:hypothetical protein